MNVKLIFRPKQKNYHNCYILFFSFLFLQFISTPGLGQREFTIGSVNLHVIPPHATDSSINIFSGNPFDHFVYFNPALPGKNLLFLFMTGTNGTGGTGKFFNELAAREGYHVINLIYPDSVAMVQICKDTLDLSCYEKARHESIFGGSLYSRLNVNESNSILNRLDKCLAYLVKKYPLENWGQFYQNGKIQWDKVVVTGQSQGGGHAAFLAKLFKVNRVIMLAAPKDYSGRSDTPPTWLTSPGKTPVNRYFGFAHTQDNVGCTFAQQVEIFSCLGLKKYGPLMNVDSSSNYSGHFFTSTRQQAMPHVSVIRDSASYVNVWKYMMNVKID